MALIAIGRSASAVARRDVTMRVEVLGRSMEPRRWTGPSYDQTPPSTGDLMDHDGDFSAYAAARWPSLVRSAVFLGCSPHEAQDLVQTALMRCYGSWGRVQRADDPDGYVFKVLLNCLRDSRRRRWWGEIPTAELPEGSAGDETAAVDIADAVHRALDRLSQANRDVVVLRYFANLSEQQTAHALGIAPGTVKSRLSRALTQLAADAHLLDPAQGADR